MHLLCTASCQQVVLCAWRILLRVRVRPLPGDSLGALGLSARLLWPSLRPLPGDSLGALGLPARLLWPSLRQRVCEGSTLCLVLPLRGSDSYLAFVPQLEAMSESLTHSIPRSFLVVALSASAVGFADALWLCPERALRLFFASVSLIDTVALSPLSRIVSADGFRHWWAFRSCGGASPHALGSVGALGDLQWLHLYRLTPDLVSLRQFAVCHWSSGRCFILLLCDVLHIFMAIILSVSLTSACP